MPERSASAAIFSKKGPRLLSSSSALHRAFTNKRFKFMGSSCLLGYNAPILVIAAPIAAAL